MERLMKNNNLQNADMLTHIETYFLNHGDVEGENTLTFFILIYSNECF